MQWEEDPESLHTTQTLAFTEKECLGVDAAILKMMQDEILITEQTKKRRQLAGDHQGGSPRYMDPLEKEEEVMLQEDREYGEEDESQSSGVALEEAPLLVSSCTCLYLSSLPLLMHVKALQDWGNGPKLNQTDLDRTVLTELS